MPCVARQSLAWGSALPGSEPGAKMVVRLYSYCALGVENDFRCATHTPDRLAQVNAQAKAQVNAQVIFPRTSVASEMKRKSFCQLRKSFCLEAQAISPGG